MNQEPTIGAPGKSDAGAGPTRRRERGARGFARETGPSLAPIPRLRNPWKPVEILSEEQVERIILAAYRILEEGGLEIRSARARALYRKAGAIVDEASQMVRMGRDLVAGALANAPAEFVLRSRDPARHLHIGGNTINFGPTNGSPNISDLDRGRRYGDLAGLRDIIKVVHRLGIAHFQGSINVEPTDLPVPVRHLHVYQAHIELSDVQWSARGVGIAQVHDALAMSAIEHRCSIDDLLRAPTLACVTNVNSPRRVDEEILENVMLMAQFGQCPVITPFTLMGAMAPVTLGGALALQTAEAMGVLALVQLVRPGVPCVMGGFTSNVDMKSGAPTFGTPEYVHAALATAQIGRRLNLPVRTSAPNASPAPDAQATYETAFSLWAAIMSHSHLINHAAGWLEGGLTASMEKIVIDAEMLRGWAEILRPIDFTDEDLGLDAILNVPAGGHFFGSPHTMARYERAFYRPLLSDWSNFENWTEAGAKDATQRANAIWKKARDEFVAPPLDIAIREELSAFVARRTEELSASSE